MSHTEMGKIMGTNESSIRSVPVEEDASQAGEVMLAMDSLANVISAALIVVDNLKARLHPILPPESKDEGINYISKSEFSCPLAKEIESEYRRIGEINEVIRYLLKNIKL